MRKSLSLHFYIVDWIEINGFDDISNIFQILFDPTVNGIKYLSLILP